MNLDHQLFERVCVCVKGQGSGKGYSLGNAKCTFLLLASWIVQAFRDDGPPRIDNHRLAI